MTQPERCPDIKKAIKYLLEFYTDLSQCIRAIDKCFEAELPLKPHPSAGNKASWHFTSSLRNPDSWLLDNAQRMYVRDKEEHHDAVLISISMTPESINPDPTLWCGHITLSSRDFSLAALFDGKTWNSDHYRHIDSEASRWKNAIKPEYTDSRLVSLEPRIDLDNVSRLDLFGVNLMELKNGSDIKTRLAIPLETMLAPGEGQPILDGAIEIGDRLRENWKP